MPPRANLSDYIPNLSSKVNYLLRGSGSHLCLAQPTANLPRDKKPRQGNITGPWLRQWGCSARGTTPGVRATGRKRLGHNKSGLSTTRGIDCNQSRRHHLPFLNPGRGGSFLHPPVQRASLISLGLRTTAGSPSPRGVT